jgi:hypothetical protein
LKPWLNEKMQKRSWFDWLTASSLILFS